MIHILNEGFDHMYVDKDALKKSKKKSVMECGDRPEEYKDFDDSMNPNNFGAELDEDVTDSVNEGSDAHFQVYDKKVKDAGYTDDEIAKVISIADEYEDSAKRGIISYKEMDEYADKIGLEDMSDSELRRTWDLYYDVLSREAFTDDDSTGIEKYKKYSDAASAFAEIINREARRRKEAGNYNPDVNESLNEAEMSDEDKADSKLLRGIHDKLRRNINARLTADEKAVIKKYGLIINKNRFRNVGDLDVPVSYRGQEMTNHLVDQDEWRNSDKINYADKARKMKERGLGYEANLLPLNYGTRRSPTYRVKDKGLLDKERSFENSVMTNKVGLMKRLLSDRDDYSTAIDAYDDDRDEIEREYQQRLADLEYDREYNKDKLDTANKDIDKLLRRNKKEESLRGKRNMRIHKTSIAEDFDEKNLNKMGTSEYEANTNRKKHIDMYRKFANLTEEEEITESNIDELALKKTACYSNREPERIKAEILGKRYSDYEL